MRKSFFYLVGLSQRNHKETAKQIHLAYNYLPTHRGSWLLFQVSPFFFFLNTAVVPVLFQVTSPMWGTEPSVLMAHLYVQGQS